MVLESRRISRALKCSFPSHLSPLCPFPHHLCPLPSPLWASSRRCVRGWGDDEECCCCDLEGFRVAQTVAHTHTHAHTQVCTHMQACAAQPYVWQIALLRLCKIPLVALLQVDCQFLLSRCPRSVLLSSMSYIKWVIMSKVVLLSLCIVVCEQNRSAFMCVGNDLRSALQTGLCAWLNLR